MYTCLNAVLHDHYERLLPLIFLSVASVGSRVVYLIVKMMLQGISFSDIVQLFTQKIEGLQTQPEDWIGP
jgi:hypothetical protein